jgi:hypothetical protein
MPSATPDEGNQWINMSYGPLSLTNASIPVGGAGYGLPLGNYAIAGNSPAINSATGASAPNHDIFGTQRPRGRGFDIGAVEFVDTPVAVANVTPTALAFGNTVATTTSAPATLTLRNTGNAALTGIGLTFTGPFARAAAGGTCGATLAAGATCTINVVFAPTAVGAASGTVAIGASAAVAGSPVALTGTGVAGALSATLTPATWSPSAARGVGASGPVQIFRLTNTGNVTLAGITQAQLGGASQADYTIVRPLSTCGPAGNGQIAGQASLAPGTNCSVAVQFRPLASDPAGSVRSATVSVTDSAGTQSAAMTGTAR